MRSIRIWCKVTLRSGEPGWLERGAVLGHEHTEPIRWAKPSVLILQRHEYYQKFKPMVSSGVAFDSIIDLSRLYQITATIKPDGKAVVLWKLRADR